MSLTSLEFLKFVIIAAVGYYVIPKKFQWIWLLIFSYIYYASSGWNILFFLLFTTATTYLAGFFMGKIHQTVSDKKVARNKNKKIVIITLVLNFGMLAVLKYTNFAITNVNNVFRTDFPMRELLLPLGISFYTFQSMGYLLDVYWAKYEPEKNPFKFALFVSFFPQILQGPIGRFNRLAKQLYEERSFQFERLERSLQLILWGFFKKMVIADNAAGFVDQVFNHYENYEGITLMVAVLGYGIQLYGDFSGGMDVVQGVSCLFGIELDQNFKRPYFAISITDFWHRWHITLGTWMKDYVFYPISLSKWMGKFSKMAKKKLGKSIGRTLPICLANVIVFLIVGVWHGAAWNFIVYGLYNGVIIGFSGLMINNYRTWKKKLHINEKSNGWHCFQVLRTFILVMISFFFDRSGSVGQALIMMKNSFDNFHISDLWNGTLMLGEVSVIGMRFLVVIFGCVVLFLFSFYEERGKDFWKMLTSQKPIVRFVFYLMLLFLLPALGQTPLGTGGFIYAQF